ncbi:hypothetical protein [Actinomadura opuntiae]|uniref:hypothetical protein n=1 Tax=Actinomadura sp. OS1-43 TaxID=604315 RepID=UPI00255AFB9F|nr:hypothetical protein [Actinomadura sp. OS1-43]MDL4820915.1 hypothetical protein [Actinomadura sp. OS1-43]
MSSIEPESTTVDSVTVYVDWSNLASVPTRHINQFVAQVGPPTRDGSPDGIYLALGHLAPPVIVSSDPELRRREIEAVANGIAPDDMGRFHLSRSRCEELITVLQEALRQYDKAEGLREQAERRRP